MNLLDYEEEDDDEILIKLLPLHPAQQLILNEAGRFNVITCGRRFGKTTLCEELITNPLLDGLPVAYFSPTYKDLFNVWDRIKHIISPIISKKDETVKQFTTITGGVLDMWSLENPDNGRGRKYARVIIDEAEKARHLKNAWEKTIRATLADYKGDCWFLSTPRFGSTYFKELGKKTERRWKSFRFTTFDNPFIDPEEIKEAEEDLDEATFRCEFLAEDVTISVNKFIYKWSRNKIIPGLESIPLIPIILSFDFNVEPITCLVGQVTNDEVRILDEYRLINSDIEELCIRIKSDYGDRMLLVTGDASGQNRTALKRDLNYYKVIQNVLNLSIGQFKVPAANPKIKNTRVLCNSLLSKHSNYHFSNRVPFLVNDIEECEVDAHGNPDDSIDKHKNHLLDCWRYFNWTFLKTFLNKMIYED